MGDGFIRADEAFSSLSEGLLAREGVETGTGFGKTEGLRVNGKIFAMLMKGRLVVKLPAERCEELKEAGGAESLSVGTRKMREWVSVEHDVSHDWAGLAGEALAFVRG